MMNGESGVKSSKKALELCKEKAFAKIHAFAVGNDMNKLNGKGKDEDHGVIKCESLENNWKVMEEIMDNDPRDCRISLELMKHFIDNKDNAKAIAVANKHIEFRGRSKEVRELLSSLLSN